MLWKMSKKEKILMLMVMLLIFLLTITQMDKSKNIHIVGDELGYWGIAAYFTGNNWSQLLNWMESYYSFGYSLVLVPLMIIFEQPEYMYQVAVLLNGGMISFCVPMGIIVAKYLFPKLDYRVVILGVFVTCSSTAYLVQSHTAWSECLLIFLFWLTLVLVLSSLKDMRMKVSKKIL